MFQRLKTWLSTSHPEEGVLRLDLARVLGASLSASAILSVVATVSAWVTRTSNWDRLVRDALIILILSILLWVLLRRGYVRLATYGVVIGFGAFAAFAGFAGIGVRGSAYGFFLLAIMASALFLNRRAAYLMAIAGSLTGLGLLWANRAGWMPNADRPMAESVTWFLQTVYFFSAAAILDLALRQIDRALGLAKHELAERKLAEDKILALNAELEQHIAEGTAQLAASEERYRLITNVTADYVFSTEVSPEGVLTPKWAAGAFASIMGCTFEDYVAGGGWPSVLHPEDVEQDARDMAALHQNQPVTTSVRVITKTGETCWVQIYAHPVWNTEAHRLEGIYGAVQNITPRKHTEEALREAELRYRTLVEQLPAITYIDDIARMGHTLYVSPQVETMLGYTPQEWLASDLDLWLALLHPEDRAQALEDYQNCFQHGVPVHSEYRMVTRTGREMWLQDRAVRLEDENGQPLLIQGIMTDITGLKQAERTLTRHAAQLTALYQLSHEIVGSLDLEQVYTAAHYAVEQLMPVEAFFIALLDAEDQEVQDVYLFDRGRRWPARRTQLTERGMTAHVIRTGEPLCIDDDANNPTSQAMGTLRFGTPEHTRSVLVVPMKLGGKAIGVISAQHYSPNVYTTEHIQILVTLANQVAIAIRNSRWNAELEQHVTDRTAELEAANRELQGFTYTIAHDLRAPARAMIGFSGLLEEKLVAQADLDPSSRDYLTRVHNGAKRMGKMIDELLEYTRLGRQTLRKQPVDMLALMYHVLEEFQPERAGRQIEVFIGNLPDWEADPEMLEQVWRHLLANAFKFTRTNAAAKIKIGAVAKNGIQQYYVRDNGVGFDSRYADKVFGVFQRLHLEEEYEGTGMGLAIVQRIIQRHGGQIWVEAEVNHGTIFYFTLSHAP